MRKILVVAASVAALGATAPVSAQLVGSQDSQEASCTKIAEAFFGNDCTYANSKGATFGGWTGPDPTGGYYAPGSVGDDPAYTPTAGDARINPSVTVDLSISGSNEISGTITIGAAARNVGTGQNTRAVESWNSIVHTLTPKVADSTSANAVGGTDYVLGSLGVPGELCLTADSTQCFIPEEGTGAVGQWNGGVAPAIGIEASPNLTGLSAPNVGTTTTGVLDLIGCADQNGTDCADSAILWSANEDPGYDNLILVVSTNASGNIVGVEGWWTQDYRIEFGAPDDPAFGNSYQAGHFTVVPVPAAVWLFGSALGLLGWVRRRVAA